jgi:hypothetical protein
MTGPQHSSPVTAVEMKSRERAEYIWAVLKSYMLDECSLDCAAVGPADEKYIINTLFNSIPASAPAQRTPDLVKLANEIWADPTFKRIYAALKDVSVTSTERQEPKP